MKSPDFSTFLGRAKEEGKNLKDAADNLRDTAAERAPSADEVKNAAKSALDMTSEVAGTISEAMAGAASSAANWLSETKASIDEAAEKKRQEEEDRRKAEVSKAREELADYGALGFFEVLGESPLPLTNDNVAKVKKTFPIPTEQCVLWAAAEFDLRPSGVAVTNKGVFVKSDVGVFDAIRGDVPGNGKSVLTYYRWDEFDPMWFTGDEGGSSSLPIPQELSRLFIEACRRETISNDSLLGELDFRVDQDAGDASALNDAVSAGMAVPIAKDAWYVDRHAEIHNQAGHGEMVERAQNMLDRLRGHSVEWSGPSNEKNGADRIVDGIEIQTKYFNTARGTLESAFDSVSGEYRYVSDNGSLMQFEVPKDQYQKVLEGFKRKIADGKVPGMSDPEQAGSVIREGKLTYQQARNLTKPGTLESLSYDAATGAVVCTCAFGISFVATAYSTYRQTGDMRKSAQAGAVAGTQVFGTTFVQHMLASQLSRTGLSDALIGPSQALVQKMGYKATQTIVNGLRTISGKSMLSGAAASSHLSKVLRGNVLTSAVTLAVLSVPETYRVANNKISGAQYAKNMAVLASSVAGGAAGAVAAGVAAGKIAGALGTAVTPGVGTVVGAAGGFIGGAAGSLAAGAVGGVLHEDDTETASRLFNAMIPVMASEYMLSGGELDEVVASLNGISQQEFKSLFEELRSTDEQEALIREFLTPLFDAAISKREEFHLPSAEVIETAIEDMAQQDDSAGVVVEVGEERLLIPEGFEPVDEFPMTADDSVGFDREDEGTAALAVVGTLSCEESLFPVDDVVSGVRGCLAPSQGLIDLWDEDTSSGRPCRSSIVKTQVDSGVQYTLTMQILLSDRVVSLTVFGQENGVTGLRDSSVFSECRRNNLVGPNLEGWAIDPFEDSPIDPFPMNLSELRDLDEKFPLHPLSELRQFARFVLGNN